VDSGASRATCPPTHAPGHAVHVPKHKLDIRAANGAEIKHYGEKHVTYTMPDAVGVPAHAHAVGYQVADVTHPIMGVAEANDRGHSILFSPAGSFVVPMALTLPEGTPNIPLQRHQNLFWMKAKANTSGAADTGDPVQLNPLSSQHAGQASSSSDNPSHEAAPAEIPTGDTVVPRSKPSPSLPSDDEIARHELTHLPPRGWCDKCVPAKAADDPHRHGHELGPIDEIHADYLLMGATVSEREWTDAEGGEFMAWTAKLATPPDPEAFLELPHSAEAKTGVLLSVLVMAHRQTSALQTILGLEASIRTR
jgi:hypothetical protein